MSTPLIVDLGDLPPGPLDAAARFHERTLPGIRAALAETQEVRLLFAPADHTHDAWRLAAVQGLAREAAPVRVNAIVGGDRAKIAQVGDYLASAPGVTGQVFEVAANVSETG